MRAIKNIRWPLIFATIILISILIPLAIYYFANSKSSTQIATKQEPEQKIIKLNDELLKTSSDLKEAKTPEQKAQITQELVTQASERKEEMLKLAEADPQTFLDTAFTPQQASSLPPEVQNLIEKDFKTEGQFIYRHIDRVNLPSKYLYKLKEGDNLYELTFANDPPQVLTGSIVEVNGIGLDSDIIIQTGDEEFPPEPPPITPPPFRVLFL